MHTRLLIHRNRGFCGQREGDAAALLRILVAVHHLVAAADDVAQRAVGGGVVAGVAAGDAEGEDEVARLLTDQRFKARGGLREVGALVAQVDELVAADAVAAALRAERLQDAAAAGLERQVAVFVPVVVVDLLHVVDVKEDDAGGAQLHLLLFKAAQGVFIRVAVEHVGQHVGVGQLLEVGHLLLLQNGGVVLLDELGEEHDDEHDRADGQEVGRLAEIVEVVGDQLRHAEGDDHVKRQAEFAGDVVILPVDFHVDEHEHAHGVDRHEDVAENQEAEHVHHARKLQHRGQRRLQQVAGGEGAEDGLALPLADGGEEEVKARRENVEAEKVDQVERGAVGEEELQKAALAQRPGRDGKREQADEQEAVLGDHAPADAAKGVHHQAGNAHEQDDRVDEHDGQAGGENLHGAALARAVADDRVVAVVILKDGVDENAQRLAGAALGHVHNVPHRAGGAHERGLAGGIVGVDALAADGDAQLGVRGFKQQRARLVKVLRQGDGEHLRLRAALLCHAGVKALRAVDGHVKAVGAEQEEHDGDQRDAQGNARDQPEREAFLIAHVLPPFPITPDGYKMAIVFNNSITSLHVYFKGK